jgi:predicted ATP-dependent endonuclease of OLD family
MKITKLELIDYKNFESVILDDLGSRVVLVGPNGCGKSAILEAISALKEFVATYQPNESHYKRNFPSLGSFPGWPPALPTPVRSGRPEAMISADFQFDETERTVAGTERATVSIKIDRATGAVTSTGVTEGIRNIFRHFDPQSGVGVIDYIGPHRTLPIQRITNLNTQQLSNEQQRLERIEFQNTNNNYQKFTNIKQYIIFLQLEDTAFNNSNLPDKGVIDVSSLRDSLAPLKEVFHHFFGPKKLIGFRRNEEGEMQIIINTPWGDHDIDQLSSGEKELFSIFVNLFRIRKLPSIILYD